MEKDLNEENNLQKSLDGNTNNKVVKVAGVQCGSGHILVEVEPPKNTSRKANLPAWVVRPMGGNLKPLGELSDEELYQRCRECGQNAKDWSRKFAALLPEVAKRGLHRRKGFVSLGEFAGKVAGMSEYAVDRILQLHAKIKDKPCLLKLFESGAEGWSKIEKVAYVAKIETDKLWAEKLVVLSTRALEVLVQSYRRKIPHVGDARNGTLFSQDGAENGLLVADRIPFFESPVRFSFPASREVEFDLRLAKQKLEKQTKQTLSWNETFQWIIQKSEIAKGKEKGGNSAGVRDESLCKNCLKKTATKHVCDECYQKSINNKKDVVGQASSIMKIVNENDQNGQVYPCKNQETS